MQQNFQMSRTADSQLIIWVFFYHERLFRFLLGFARQHSQGLPLFWPPTPIQNPTLLFIYVVHSSLNSNQYFTCIHNLSFIGQHAALILCSLLYLSAKEICICFCIVFVINYFCLFNVLKGNVQRKLRWVKNSANHCILAWDCGAGHNF